MSVEVNITQVTFDEGRQVSRSWGSLTIDENDPSVPPKITQSLDGRTVVVLLHALRKIEAEHAQARADFGDPEQQ
jgi:hypothetical protein